MTQEKLAVNPEAQTKMLQYSLAAAEGSKGPHTKSSRREVKTNSNLHKQKELSALFTIITDTAVHRSSPG